MKRKCLILLLIITLSLTPIKLISASSDKIVKPIIIIISFMQ